MTYAARMQASLAKSVVAVSTKLSIAVVLGLAATPLLPQDATSPRLASPALGEAHVALVTAKPVPVGEPAAAAPTFELAAARRRQARESRESTQGGATAARRKSAISAASGPAEPPPQSAAEPNTTPKQAETAPASEARPDGGAEQAAADPPRPETWSDAEVIAALRDCVRLLAPIASEVELAQPTRHHQCGAPAPVLVKRIGSGASKVEINPPAELNCPMVVSLHAWVENTLQPSAREALGTTVIRLRNASGYVCRARNGHPLGTDKLSEHALANAIDIAGFITADGRTVDVARGWGMTERDKREAERIAAARVKDGKEEKPAAAPERTAKSEPVKTAQVDKKISLIAVKAEAQPPAEKSAAAKLREAGSGRRTAALARARGTSDISADPNAVPAPPTSAREMARRDAEAAFLRRLHKGACTVFGTVLGPEANDLHRDHFHFDLASRRRNALCQ